ncbi:hypothetical protein [Candidatus Protochlamydia phocaeensis]|uniref:hypothetical protein n=1 Tax=Candidatus Protochlamydia phocaeensis TaxID=1414722 RepID=UPI000838B4A2|nr:hypothetical protein [Candidatus Protochlamydia phocaeensis]
MKKMNKIFALATLMAMLAGQVQGQEYESDAYYDSGRASSMSAWIPIGALVVAGVLIATTDRHHHHHHGSGSGSSSHSHYHAHY